MKCIYCGGDTKVKFSRKSPENIFRRRYCKECGKSYWTKEVELSKFEAMNVSHSIWHDDWVKHKAKKAKE